MKKIFKEKGSLIARCIVFQIAMSMLGLFVTSPFVNSSKLFIALSGVFAILFYYALMGATLNEDGLKDNLVNKRNNLKTDYFYGMKYVAVSYIPSLVISVFISVCNTFGFLTSISDTLNFLFKAFFGGMFLGIDIALFTNNNFEYSFFSTNYYSIILYQFISIAICGLFYYIGMKGINLIKIKEKEDK